MRPTKIDAHLRIRGRKRAPGAAVLLMPYDLTPNTDDATILAHVARWLDAQPARVAHSLADYLRANCAPEEA